MNCVLIVCYLFCRTLYWSDLGAVAKIERSRLDGTERSIFVSADLDKPLGLSVDLVDKRLYWVDDFRDTIESVELLTGANRRTISVSRNIARSPKLFALAVFEVQHVYVLYTHNHHCHHRPPRLTALHSCI